MYTVASDAPASVTNITSSFLADELDDETLAEILDVAFQASPSPGVLRAVELRVLGGAIARVADDATAFAHRRRRLACSVVAAGFAPRGISALPLVGRHDS